MEALITSSLSESIPVPVLGAESSLDIIKLLTSIDISLKFILFGLALLIGAYISISLLKFFLR